MITQITITLYNIILAVERVYLLPTTYLCNFYVWDMWYTDIDVDFCENNNIINTLLCRLLYEIYFISF